MRETNAMSEANIEPPLLGLEELYGPGAEQICTECCIKTVCDFHKRNSRIVGCTHYSVRSKSDE
jgi:hypothetical protein